MSKTPRNFETPVDLSAGVVAKRVATSAFFLALAVLAASCAAGDATKTDETLIPYQTPLWTSTGDPSYKSPHDSPIVAANITNQSTGLADDWYADSAFYHVWVKAFNDSDGDGCGDIPGITAKLSYIQDEVGCDALWLSPIFACDYAGTADTVNMHGYDTVDYYAINPLFGDDSDVSALLAAAHGRGMKVIFDYVPNHTSAANPWFAASRAREASKTDWYLWQNAKLTWSPMGSASTWYLDSARSQYYYAPFWSGMPDLNFRNVEVREEMTNVARYWLNRGFDGMRIDAIRYLIEDQTQWAETPETHAWFSELRKTVVDAYADLGSPKLMLGEAWVSTGQRSKMESYFGTGENEFSMLFDFDFAGQAKNAALFANESVVTGMYAKPLYAESGTIASMLSNHDNLADRPATLYADPYQLRLATALSLLRPTVPFIYYGNEIGQKNAAGYTAGQDIRLRYPLDWNEAAAEIASSDSLLAYHRSLLALRKDHTALRRGDETVLVAPAGGYLPAGVTAYALSDDAETLVCVYNLTASAVAGPVSLDLSSLTGVSGCTPLFGDPVGAAVTEAVLTIDSLAPYAARLYRVDQASQPAAADITVQESPGAP